MQAPPVVVKAGAPGLVFETWEIAPISDCATSRTGTIAREPASGSSTGVTVE
jgi:hypothetical protein